MPSQKCRCTFPPSVMQRQPNAVDVHHFAAMAHAQLERQPSCCCSCMGSMVFSLADPKASTESALPKYVIDIITEACSVHMPAHNVATSTSDPPDTQHLTATVSTQALQQSRHTCCIGLIQRCVHLVQKVDASVSACVCRGQQQRQGKQRALAATQLLERSGPGGCSFAARPEPVDSITSCCVSCQNVVKCTDYMPAK